MLKQQPKAESGADKKTLRSAGFTIIEVMIVLAVSGGMLSAAAVMISGQQERAQFSTSVREVENKLVDIFNDVETGYYPNNGSINCRVVSGESDANARPSLVAGPGPEQGTNQDCLFLGKAIQFYKTSSTDPVSNYRSYTMIGRRQAIGNKDVANILEAKPTAFDESVETGSFSGAVEVTEVRYPSITPNISDASPNNVRESVVVVAPLGAFSALEPSTAASNGKPRLADLNFGPNGFDNNAPYFRSSISNLEDPNVDHASKGVVICLRNAAGGRVAAVAVGVAPDPGGGVPVAIGQRLATQAYFDEEAAQLGCKP